MKASHQNFGGPFCEVPVHGVGIGVTLLSRSGYHQAMQRRELSWHVQAPVPVAIGGAGLPEDIVFREDLPKAGLANITGTYLNLLGFATPAHMEPSLI